MSASNAAEAAFLDLLFLNIAFGDVGDVTGLRGSTVAGNLYIALHTADPGETGDQTTNEVAYTGHTRAAVPRDGTGFSRTDNVITNVGLVSWGTNAGAEEVATHFSIGTDSAGAGTILCSGALEQSLTIITGMTPQAVPEILAVTFD